MMGSERKLAVVMFTDIAGYTALMQRDEQDAILIRNTHRTHFNNLTNKYEGSILQYYGDGTLSIFHSAHQAVLCGIELQKAYRSDRQIPVRIGLHMGEIIFDEDEIIGDAVNVASRIESLAPIGSVLVSKKIYEEVKNKREINGVDLGAFRLKNVSQPVRVFAIDHDSIHVPQPEELSDKFDVRQKVVFLPKYPNTFVGRTHHITTLCRALQDKTTRLISLIGAGGMGKTRLSVKVGELVADSFEDGVCFVALDTIMDYEEVPLQIGHRLRLKESFESTWISQIINFLQNKHLLLILDNLEQILEATTIINQILHKCPKIKILATSRETLGLSLEIEYPLDGLNRPNSRLHPGPEDLLKFDAIDLFVRTAKLTTPQFRLNEKNAACIIEICQELDGLPLAIELAAARIKLFTPTLLLKKLRDNSNLLGTRSKDVAARHQTIQNTVKWSYDLLQDSEKELFRKLSLFRGGFSPESIEAISPGDDGVEVIESFINKSLVYKTDEVHDVPYFKMIKLIRDYGLHLLKEDPKRDHYLDRFKEHYISFIENSISKLRGPNQTEWLNYIEAEHKNLEVVLEWLILHQYETAGSLGSRLWQYHLRRGFLREGIELLKTILSLPIQDNKIKAKLLEGAGVLSQNLGQYLEAQHYLKQSLEIWTILDDQGEVARALNNLAWLEWRIGHFDSTESYSEKALQISIDLNDCKEQARSINNLGWTLHSRGIFEKCIEMQQKVLQLHLQTGNQRGVAFAKINLGRALLRVGKKREALHMIKEARESFEELKDQQLLTFSKFVNAEYLYEGGDLSKARNELTTWCIPDFEKIGDLWGVAISHYLLGRIYLEEVNDQSEICLAKALDIYEKSHDHFGSTSTKLALSKLLWKEGILLQSENYLTESLDSAGKMGANELLRDGFKEKARRAQQKQLPWKALMLYAIADYYAQFLGEYQWKKFRTSIHDFFKSISELIRLRKVGDLNQSLEKLLVEESNVIGKLEHIELVHHIQTLIDYALKIPSTPSEPISDMATDLRTSSSSPEDQFVQQVRAIVEKNLPNAKFTIRDLCDEVGISHSQLHRRLSASTGMSTTKFIRSIRLEKAKVYLSDATLTVTAIAYDTGFRDPDYFYRVFKKAFSMTPREFRNSLKSEETRE